MACPVPAFYFPGTSAPQNPYGFDPNGKLARRDRKLPDVYAMMPLPLDDDSPDRLFLDGDEAWHVLGLALPPCPPPPALRLRVFADVLPFAPFQGPLSRYMGLPEAQFATLLGDALKPERFRPSGFPGVRCLGFRGSRLGLLEVEPGFGVPEHGHRGEEKMMVLRGSCWHSDGRILSPTDTVTQAEGEVHAFIAREGETLLLALLSTEVYLLQENRP